MDEPELRDGPWWLVTMIRIEMPGADPVYITAATQEQPAHLLLHVNRTFKKLGDSCIHYLIHSIKIEEADIDEAIVTYGEY